jgi:hypothetical protein
MLQRSGWASLAARNGRWGRGEVLSPSRSVRHPTDAARESGTYGGQGKAAGCVPPTALLYERHSSGAVNFDLDQRARVRSGGGIYALRFLTKRAQLVLQSGTDLGHQVGGLFLFGGGLIRCNLIRDTVQTQHKHIPRQCNGHHSCYSEPQSSPSFVVSFKLLGFHDLRCVPIRTSLHVGVSLTLLKARGLEARCTILR